MIKKLLSLLSVAFLATSLNAMQHDDKTPSTPEHQPCVVFLCPNNTVVPDMPGVEYDCPLCCSMRKFPNFEFIIDRMQQMTEEERMSVYNQVYDYKGDVMPGRYCPFCCMEITKEK